jgi:hypothetical protein
VTRLASPSAASADSLTHWLDTALRTSGSLYRPGAPTADALIETGDIAPIEDHQIRRLVLTHRGRVHQVAAVFNVLDEASLDVIASLNGRVDRLALSRRDVDWMVVAADPVVRGDLYTQLTAVDARHAYTDYLLQSVRPLINALEERVGSP